ncbi:MAG: RNA-directed DNA polymerase, partial [Bacteroidetes bacterium]|nr:RNA-directed DNA polymerase [Bacteroidota bacterium]
MASNSDQNRRENIRREIAQTSKDEFILKEMKRLGFWPNEEGKPRVEENLIKRQGELSREIADLSKKARIYQDREALLNKHRKERMHKSREKQKANKEKREAERLTKKEAWKEKQAKDIIYLGDKYSAGLKNKTNDLALLKKHQLPQIQNVLELAKCLKTNVSELRYLSYYRPVTKVSHYIRYALPKKNGGNRQISAPMPRLKTVQRAILDELLVKVPISQYANGFAPGRSIVTNASPHVNADLIVNMDLKDFFPTISYKRVWGMFKKLGFSDQNATVLALICTEPVEEKVEVDGEIYYISEGERVLPQGAPTSPAITNIICRRMDQRMAGIAKKLDFT